MNPVMRVLVANIPLPANRFLADLNGALSRHVKLDHSSDAFWNMEGDYDLVHLHFPEYLTFALQDAYINGLEERHIEDVSERLAYWAGRARIVVTRHVLLPHDALEDPMWERMYETVYRHADGVVHFARASVQEFESRYAGTRFHRGRAPLHSIIPHHNYSSLPNRITRADARRALGIAADAAVMLVFGAIRNETEKELILNTFRDLRTERKVLLVSNWREKLANVAWIRLRYWIRDIVRLYYRTHPRYRFNHGFVEEADAQVYLNAADVLFIPRLRVLNSGNVTLGMTFGRVVVGPDSWDVGELLRETGNPVFDPDRAETAAAAMEQGFALAREGRTGEGNRQLALSRWDVAQCAQLYVAFFRTLVNPVPASVSQLAHAEGS